MLFGFFLTLGVAVLSAGLRSFQNSFTQKAGALGILAATFLGVYFVTGSWMSWLVARTEDAQARWDRANVHELTGTYGQYLLSKVSKVFPELTDDVL